MKTAPIPTATITRIHPDGSTLADAAGRPLFAERVENGVHLKGSAVLDGDTVTHTTPDGATGCISLSAKGVAIVIKTVRAPEVEEQEMRESFGGAHGNPKPGGDVPEKETP